MNSSPISDRLLLQEQDNLKKTIGPVPRILLTGGGLVFVVVIILLVVGLKIIGFQQSNEFKNLVISEHVGWFELGISPAQAKVYQPGMKMTIYASSALADPELSFSAELIRLRQTNQAILVEVKPDKGQAPQQGQWAKGRLVANRISLWNHLFH